MHQLRRTVRFCVSPTTAAGDDTPRNGFAGSPRMRGIGAYYEIDVTCRGMPDSCTGYLVDIRAVDAAVRERCVPLIAEAARRGGGAAPTEMLAAMLASVQAALPVEIVDVRWRLTPYYSVAMSPAEPGRAVIRQQFEFSAAHRLHVDSMSAEENAAAFGKCNNPNGHGHNYRLEVAVETAASAGATLDLARLEAIVLERVVDRFDHRHLNLDTGEFASLNPSVEHIARACHGLLDDAVAAAGGRLREVTVWETPKTSCTYSA